MYHVPIVISVGQFHKMGPTELNSRFATLLTLDNGPIYLYSKCEMPHKGSF